MTVLRSPGLFQNIPIKFKTHEICKLAIKLQSDNIYWVPDEMLTVEFCVELIKDSFPNMYEYTIQSIIEKIPAARLNVLAPLLIRKCHINILWDLKIQTRDLCLICYRQSRRSYHIIESSQHRRFVVRAVITDIVGALRPTGLSTNLLVEILEQMSNNLYPSMGECKGPLSPTQLWSIVALVKHM